MNETVLISGATSSIGQEIAHLLSKKGYNLVLVGRNDDKLKKLKDALPSGACISFVFDNNEINTAPTFFKTMAAKVNKIDHFVACSGFHKLKPLRVSKPRDFSDSFKLNTEATFVFTKHITSNLFDAGSNRSIIYISSIASLIGEAGLSAYSASKAGLVAGAKCLALELATKNIRVNCVSPGWVVTDHTKNISKQLDIKQLEEIEKSYPLGFGTPSDISNLVEFLVSNKSRWITGQNIVIDGGKTV